MARGCNCTGTTCGCSVVAGSGGIVVDGNGSSASPFVVSVGDLSIGSNLQVNDTDTLDLTLGGSGTISDPFIISGVAKPAVSTGTWTPTLTGITLGTGGSATAAWTKIGRKLRAVVDIVFGSSGFATSGQMSLALPQNMIDSQPAGHILGQASFTDTSASAVYQGAVIGAGSVSAIGISSLAALGLLATALPFAIGAGDKISLVFEYPTAS